MDGTMPESAPSITELLTLILGVLERVDEKLALHDEQTRHLTTNVSSKDGLHRNASLSDARHYLDFDDIAKPSIAFRACENGTPRVPKRPGKLPYREWHLNQLEGPLDNDMVKLLQSHIGDWYKIPGDNRLPLSYSRYGRDHQFESETFSMSEYIHYSPPNYSLSRLKAARAFDETLRICNGCDFVVIDFDAQNHHILYRMGEEAIGTELLIPDSETIAENDLSAPWSRLILFQGMTTGNCLNPDTTAANNYKAPVPYFDQVSGGPGLWSHINTHLQNRGRSVTANPYDDEKLGFTTTFYEIIKERTEYHELWRHGPLYDDPLGRLFRKSSYTLYVLSSAHRGQDKRDGIYYTIGHWTMLVLSPSHFFDQSNTSFPMSAISPLDKPISGQFVGRLTKLGAEMNMIGQGLQRISDRWTDFQSFFEYILDSGDALMQPTKHDNLLFDDGSFSRSRRYFWAIDCLSEFEKNITDNLTQWELWRTARIEARVRAGALSELDMAQYRFVEQHYRVLSKQREYFRQKLALTVALRDALFNASAVIESRASTRLGENVKLLTFVSIFFLPLSFCTSLFSTTQPSNGLLPTILSVGLATYLVVLNINTLVQSFHALYNSQKRRLVCAMKADKAAYWRTRGRRFEIFKPKHERIRPSEWYIPLYAALRIGGLRRLLLRKFGSEPPTEPNRVAQNRTAEQGRAWWRFRMKRTVEPLWQEEGWVM